MAGTYMLAPAASALAADDALPDFVVQSPGLLVASADGFDSRPFDTAILRGKVASIQMLAGRRGIDARNADYVEALRNAGLASANFDAVTIVDQGQAMMGTKGFVRDKIEDKQREFPTSTFVLDGDSMAVRRWGVEKKGYAVVVVDVDGTILAFHDGVLSAEQIDHFVASSKTRCASA